MSSWRRLAWALLPLFIAGAFLAWVVFHDAGRTCVLPDGRVLTVRAVTWGTNHFYAEGNPLVKLRRRFLSTQRATELGLRSYRHDTGAPALVLWTHTRWSADVTRTNFSPLLVAAIDQRGVPAEPEFFSRPDGNVIPGRMEALEIFRLLSFPRREKSLRVAVYALDAAARPSRVGAVRIRNPAASDYPVWPASPMPVNVQDGELKFTLVDLAMGVPAPANPPRPRGQISPWSAAKFQVTANGALTTNWTVAAIDARDATGNAFPLRSLRCAAGGDALVAGFREVLWPGEPAWKLRVEFSRVAGFASSEWGILRDLPVPTAGQPVTNSTAVHAGELVIDSMVLTRFGNDGMALPGQFRPNVHMTLATPGKFAGFRMSLLRAVDGRGRTVAFNDGYLELDGRFSLGLDVPRDAGTLDLTLAIRRSRIVEFTVKPAASSGSRFGGAR